MWPVSQHNHASTLLDTNWLNKLFPVASGARQMKDCSTTPLYSHEQIIRTFNRALNRTHVSTENARQHKFVLSCEVAKKNNNIYNTTADALHNKEHLKDSRAGTDHITALLHL